MAVDDIDGFREQLPDVFENRSLPTGWEDDWLLIPLPIPEKLPLIEDVEMGWGETSAPQDWGLFGAPDAPVPTLPVFGDLFPGNPTPDRSTLYPPPDALAFYLPFHYFHPHWWGIYLTIEGTQQLRNIIVRESKGALLPDEAMLAARLFLYGHEAYHHAVEVFATRLESTHRRPLYRLPFEDFYRRTLGTDRCLEEALASAYGVQKAMKTFPKQKAKKAVLRRALRAYIGGCPPGYRRAVDYERTSTFRLGQFGFAEDNHAFAFGVPPLSSDVWAVFPHAFTGITRITSRVNYIVHQASPLAQRLRLGLRYLRKRELDAILAKQGCVKWSERGPHEKWRTPDGRSIAVPRHREIANGTARSILQAAGLTGRLEDMLQV